MFQPTLSSFFGGDSNSKKRKTEEEKAKDKKQRGKEYDRSQRKRSFQDSWKKDFEWLTNEAEQDLMYCKWCRVSLEAQQLKKISNFVTGTSNFKRETIKHHSENKIHQQLEGIEKAKSIPVGHSEAEKAVKTMDAANHARMKKIFTITFTSIRHRRPFSDLVWQLELAATLGLDVGEFELYLSFYSKAKL